MGHGGLVDRAADLGPCDPSLIPLGHLVRKRKISKKEAVVGPYFKKSPLWFSKTTSDKGTPTQSSVAKMFE